MSTPHQTHSAKGGRDTAVGEEQAFCLQALESGAYDSISDGAWVALCEQVATKARQVAEQDTDEVLLSKRTAHHGERYEP